MYSTCKSYVIDSLRSSNGSHRAIWRACRAAKALREVDSHYPGSSGRSVFRWHDCYRSWCGCGRHRVVPGHAGLLGWCHRCRILCNGRYVQRQVCAAGLVGATGLRPGGPQPTRGDATAQVSGGTPRVALNHWRVGGGSLLIPAPSWGL